ncbi:MAG TPA: GMC family oxidoreductase N-terminal domain-containing protein [Actinoplanes sp.]|nr:GMC family oxidoreductase N-terminal domain-containing protein [Actinoplanes sp.]
MQYNDTYDYIVVGAGSAGCVVARRLVDRDDCRVLLLEAGGPDDSPAVHRTDVATMTSMWGDDEFVWPHVTTGQDGLRGRAVSIPQGRLLGGGSSVNAMMYVRGNRRDFDHWRSLGNPGWGYDDVLPYFRRSEDFVDGADDYRGADGPMKVVHYERASDASRAFAKAAVELGFRPPGFDYNGAQQENGPFFYQSTRTKDNQRCSTAVAFLDPVADHPNLTVVTGALASRVLLDRGTAVGVEYAVGSELHRVRARSEVILTCGALTTPGLLMRSGIGPAAHLSGLGIDTIVDLPGVGKNLQDHLLFGVAYQSLVELAPPALLSEAGMFLHTAPAAPEASPDLQFFFGPIQFVADSYRVDGPGFTFAPILAQPRSRGTVTLRSADPQAMPVVDPHYLRDDADLEVLLRGIEIARDLAHTNAFDGLRGRELAPGDAVVDRASLSRYVRDNATTVWHPVGTCRMGADRDAVVDAQLRVHDVARLRVADASIMPTITCGNTNAATIMIAEKAADLIAADRGQGASS